MESRLELRQTKKIGTRALVKIGMLSAIAYIIMFIEFPIPIFPAFLKLDFSDIPALIGGFAISPIAGVLIQLVKNLLHFITKTSTGGVGELGNFLVGGVYVFVASHIYKNHHNKKGAILGCIAGTLIMTVAGGIFNLYVLIPFYANIMPVEAIISMGSAITARIHDVPTLVLYGIVPFNIVKGIVVSMVTILVYKRVSPLLKRK
ncbi:MAG: ECF transporter S component [Proteocatella sp.]